jgi:hypothetical protein
MNIPFPSVPNVLGVPPLPRSPSASTITQSALGVVQGTLWTIFQSNTQWGIYDSAGNPLADPSQFQGVTADVLSSIGWGSVLSTNSVEFYKETRVSDFPVEGGGFASYNKVEMPAEPQVILCLSASTQDRTKFLNDIDLACKSTDLYSIVTPEKTYINYTIERYGYARKSTKGTTLLIMELSLKEVRAVSSQLSTTTPIESPKEAVSEVTKDSGKVQPKTASQSVFKTLSDKVSNFTSYLSDLIGVK